MRKKFVLLLLTVTMSAMTLVGCGHGNDASSTSAEYAEDTGPAIPDDSNSATITTEPCMNEDGEVLTQAPNDDIDEDYDFGRSPEEDLVPWDEMENEDVVEEMPAEVGEIEGIVVLQTLSYHGDDGISNIFVYSIQCINPDTGSSIDIAEFSARRPYNVASEDAYYLLPTIGDSNLAGNDRRYFSSDFSKMAVTKIFNDKNEAHAGWLDQSGNFFDVTEALGEQSSDFGDPVTYNAVGFTEDDLFVYNDNPYAMSYTWGNLNFRFTDSKAPVTSQEGNPLEKYCQIVNGNNEYAISDYVDDHLCLIYYHSDNNKTTSEKYDVNTEEAIPYIPGESRSNWSGVCSPDRSQIAFLSAPQQGNGGPDIFIIPFDGGEPVKLECDITFSSDISTNPSSLLEWK